MDEKEALVREHEELVQLYIHEDAMAWNLIFFFLAANIAIVSGIGALVSLGIAKFSLLVISFLCVFGAIVGFLGFFTLQRSRIHRESRLFRAEDIEEELRKKKLVFDTFLSAEATIHKELKYQRGGGTVALKRREKVESLRYFPYFVLAIAIIWLSLSIVLLIFAFQSHDTVNLFVMRNATMLFELQIL